MSPRRKMMLGPRSPQDDLLPSRTDGKSRSLVKRPHKKSFDKDKMKEFGNEAKYDNKHRKKKT
jgi:hypothetical protein